VEFLRSQTLGAEAFMTRGAQGAVYSNGREWISCPTVPIARPEDLTGAGDLFVAGMLWARVCRRPPLEQAALGNAMARAVIQVLGTRDLDLPGVARTSVDS
jgi:sugar/nucleoside kinase (ribokinase family)